MTVVRRELPQSDIVSVPGARVSPYSNQMVAYRDGLPIAVGLLGEILSRLQQAGETSVVGVTPERHA